MKAMVKKVGTMVIVGAMVITSFISGALYTANNTQVTIGEDSKLNIFVNDTNVSQREMTEEEVQFVEANNKMFAGGLYGDLRWTWENGVLTISGKGKMLNTMGIEATSVFEYPWQSYANETTKIIIENGVTTIGDYAFDMFHNVETVLIANTVEKIGVRAFQYGDALETCSIPSNCKVIEEGAFAGCHNLTMPYPNNVTVVGEDAFAGVNIL